MEAPAFQEIDPYLKKTVDLKLRNKHLTFAVSQTLFSSHQIDVGTLQLLKTLESHRVRRGGKLLDLGCGYGPLGLTLAALNEGTQVHLVDRDALAVVFTQHNAERNDLSQTYAYGSLAYDQVSARDFDLIVANIPGKAGSAVIRAMLLDARAFLAPEGRVAIVVVSPLEDLVAEVLSSPEVEILLHQTAKDSPGSSYAIFHYRFVPPALEGPWIDGSDRGIYDREELSFVFDTMTLQMRTAHGLPEFDTLSFATQLLIKAIQGLDTEPPRNVAIFNPGQGQVPVVAWRTLSSRSVGSVPTITLTDRDLLSLHYARMNLIASGCEASSVDSHHLVALMPDQHVPDLVVGVLREDEGPAPIEHALARVADGLRPGTQLLIGGGSTPITRVLDAQQINATLRLVKRKRSRGNSTALLQRR
jgi:16S rRNA (guanine1207-N2)-methyltransferase